MGKLDDYIKTLDGTNIDPVVMASTVLQLHNEEMELANGKIASLETAKVESDNLYKELEEKHTQLKGKAWDLANRVPVVNANTGNNNSASDNDDIPTGDESFEDFYDDPTGE